MDDGGGKKPYNSTFYKTQTIKSSLSPTYDENCNVILLEHHTTGKIMFNFYDYDFGSADDEMGFSEVKLSDYPQNEKQTAWFDVKPSKDCKDAKGSLHLSFSYSLTPPPQKFDMDSMIDGKESKYFLLKITATLKMMQVCSKRLGASAIISKMERQHF